VGMSLVISTLPHASKPENVQNFLCRMIATWDFLIRSDAFIIVSLVGYV
jgi:hypothetical protein